jgi:hypothetical protein
LSDIAEIIYDSDEDKGAFEDVITELNLKITPREAFLLLPRHIQGIAFSWGFSDTCFRDAAYEFLEDEFKNG